MNQFIVGLPARDIHFYGRSTELANVMNQRWAWICSQRRMGKTSLLRKVEEEYKKKGFLVLYCDLALINEKKASGADLFKTIVRTERRKLRKHGISLDDFSETEYRDSFADLLEELDEKDIKVAFLWDEAERLIHIEKNDRGFLENLRAQLLAFTQFRFVISSTQLLSNIFQFDGDCSSFMGTFRWTPLSNLNFQQSLDLLSCEQSDGWKSPISNDILTNVIKWSGGHPLILQELGDSISNKTSYQGNQVTEEVILTCKREIHANPNLKKIIEDDFAKLSTSQQSILTLLCQNEDTYFEIGEIANLTELKKDELQEAIDFLDYYGYINMVADKVVLNFKFYPRLLPKGKTHSNASESKLAKIRRNVFISYSHKDKAYFDLLNKGIEPLVRNHEIEIWHDEKILPGAERLEEIERSLLHSWASILIISPDFIHSDFITNVEIPKLLTNAKEKGCKILCLYARHSAVEHISWEVNNRKFLLTDFQGINSINNPLSSLSENEQEKLILECAETLLSL